VTEERKWIAGYSPWHPFLPALKCDAIQSGDWVSLKSLVPTAGFHPWSFSFLKVAWNPRYTGLFTTTEEHIMHFLHPCNKGRKDRRSFFINFPCTRFRCYILYRIFTICHLNCPIFQHTSEFRISKKIPDFRKNSEISIFISIYISILNFQNHDINDFTYQFESWILFRAILFVDMLFTLLNLNKKKLKFVKGEKCVYKRNSMKRSYFLGRKFLFDKIKVCMFTLHSMYIYIRFEYAHNILYARLREKLSDSDHF